MALEKAVVPISFSGGLDLKNDEKQVVPGKLLLLENAKFQTGKELRKVPGDAPLSTAILGSTNTIQNAVSIASFQNELVLNDGLELYSYSPDDLAWSDKGQTYATSFTSVQPVIRNNYAQVDQDSAMHSSGLQIFAWEDSSGGSRYSVIDSSNNLQIQHNVLISSTAATPKCTVTGNYLVISYYEPSPHRIRVLAIPIATPTLVPTPIDVAVDIDPTNPVFDSSIIGPNIYYSYNVIGGGIGYFYINSFLSKSVPHYEDAENASVAINVFGDTSDNMWVCYYNGTAVKAFIVNSTLLTVIQPPTIIETLANVRNVTGSVILTTGTIFYEVSAPITYNHFIRANTFTLAGAVGTPYVVIRSVGLGSKAFPYNGNNFVLSAYQGPLQPGYFLIDQNGIVAAKLAPQTGGGLTAKSTLPSVNNTIGTMYQFCYLQQDFFATTIGGNFFLTGVMQATLDFNPTGLISVDIGNGLQTNGGFLSSYDGVSSVELGYHVFPEQLTITPSVSGGGLSAGTYQWCDVYAWTDNFGQIHRSAPSIPVSTTFSGEASTTFNSQFSASTNQITADNILNLFVGQTVTDNTTSGNILADTIITAMGTNYITFTAPFSPGDTSITVSSPAGLYIGQTVTDNTTPGNILSGTTITNVVGNVVSLSNPMQGPSAAGPGDSLSVNAYLVTISTVTQGASAAYPGDSMSAVVEPVIFTSVFGAGATQLNVSSTDGLFIGQTITDTTTSGNILAGTTITAINGDVITISSATTADSASAPGDTLQTLDVYSATLSAPTLRITAKRPPIRTNAWVELYRTQANQTIFYLVSDIKNPTYNNPTVDTVTFTDVDSDIDIQSNLQLYTTGGVIEYISPPAPKLIWPYSNRLILVPAESPNSWWYSNLVIPGVPLTFTDSFVNNMDSRDGPITAGAQMDSEIVFFKGPTSVFYVSGQGPDPTGNNNSFTLPQIVPTGAGCTNPFSVISTPNGIMYQSLKGIYLLSRSLVAQYIGAEVETFNSFSITSGQLLQNDNEIRYTFDNGTMLLYDYYYSQWSTIPAVNAVASCAFQQEFCYVQPNGVVLQEDPNIWTHNGNFRRIKLITSWLSLNALQGFQRVYKMFILGTYISPHQLKVNVAVNFNPNFVQEEYIYASNLLSNPAYGIDSPYGSGSPYGGQDQTYQWRICMARQKCETVQLTLEEIPLLPYGEGLSLSAVTVEVGSKQGGFRLPASKSF